ncbi:unnamed protein product [Bemisia tabaci]|uniref:Ig-like domain-containing protein n=1 Tax=Bemisia tabaci TaxID=7038 RepID=A0AAI8Y5X4_BEMTA|nr:PREDICTED: uncharacterized protein LOC109033058 [Bemisia tabaci]CAH0746925.1 unnamed protein product [Bemisia tabaci]
MHRLLKSSVILLNFLLNLVRCEIGGLSPAWQQYFPDTTWATYPEQLHYRPSRLRIGQGSYRMLPPTSAELNCDFPDSMLMLSNIVWERADMGMRDLNTLYRRHGIPHQYDVHVRPRGSTLHLFDVSPIDRGLYRCIATAMDPANNRVITLFQDTEFYPDLGLGGLVPEVKT